MNQLKYIALFLGLILLQVLIFNNLAFLGYMNPYVYILFLLYLPSNLNRSTLLIIAFALGLCVDVFENTGGIHASASMLLAFVRPNLLKLVSQRQGDDSQEIRIKEFGLISMAIYSASAILIHHFVLFLLEAFSFKNLGIVLLRTLYSSTFTFIFVLFVQLWNFRRRD